MKELWNFLQEKTTAPYYGKTLTGKVEDFLDDLAHQAKFDVNIGGTDISVTVVQPMMDARSVNPFKATDVYDDAEEVSMVFEFESKGEKRLFRMKGQMVSHGNIYWDEWDEVHRVQKIIEIWEVLK